MPLKKSELYASLWKSCDELRGGMDASQYKDYVLVLLFMKYVSDKAASRPDYDLIVPPGGSFADMVALKNKADIGEGINKVIATLAEANENLRGAIDVADFNDPDKLGKGKDKVDRLTNLVAIFENPSLDFRGNSAEGDDLLGDAYEYLMRNFATESGKSKGQFYTPAEVSRIMAAVVGVTKATSGTQSIYDPTCGSGSLLLKAHDAAKNATGLDLAIYGQEMDNATAALARMNMVLHDATTAEIWQDNTLASPYFRDASGGLKTFDYCVANPPFSTKSWMNGFDPAHDTFDRFRYGMPPPKNGDYAFLLHMLASLKSTGRAAVILPHGVLFRGNAEATIRRQLISHGMVEAIIGLPANLFYGTGIPACIIVLDKAQASERDGIFVIDASRGFVKDGNKNRLRAQDIHRVVDTFTRRLNVDGYSRLVSTDEVAANDFNLNITRYLDSHDEEDHQDVIAHLFGGIPARDVEAMSAFWDLFPDLEKTLFVPAGRPGYFQLAVPADAARAVVTGHPGIAEFNSAAMAAFSGWRADARAMLLGLEKGQRSSDLIADLSESLLERFRAVRLIDPYAVYQRLMEFWRSDLQDDAHLIAEVGWLAAARPRLLLDGKDRAKEAPDYVAGAHKYKSDLVPVRLLIDRYLAADRTVLGDLEAEQVTIDEQLADLIEEHGVEGGLLEDVVADNGKLTKQAVKARLKATDPVADADEVAQLLVSQRLLDRQAEVKACTKAATDALNAKAMECYTRLEEEDVKSVVIDDKWLDAIEEHVRREVVRVSSEFATRVSEIAARYAVSLPGIEAAAADSRARVDVHLSAWVER